MDVYIFISHNLYWILTRPRLPARITYFAFGWDWRILSIRSVVSAEGRFWRTLVGDEL